MLALTLAVAHHVLVFGLVAMTFVQRTLLKAPAPDIARLARVDAGIGGAATLVLIVGVCRVIWGGKGWAFYEANPWFWAKIGTFFLIGLISLIPTLRILAWRKAQRAAPAFQPPPAELARVRAALGAITGLLFLLIAFAAVMARWPF